MFYNSNDYRQESANWTKRWSLIPRRCKDSNRLIWLIRAYRGRYIITGPGDPVVIDYWVHPEEFLLWQLKRRG